jgi:hypothetical protein
MDAGVRAGRRAGARDCRLQSRPRWLCWTGTRLSPAGAGGRQLSGAAASGRGVLVRELWDNQQEILASHISGGRTVVEQGNPDGTLVLLMKGLEHVKVFISGREDITST